MTDLNTTEQTSENQELFILKFWCNMPIRFIVHPELKQVLVCRTDIDYALSRNTHENLTELRARMESSVNQAYRDKQVILEIEGHIFELGDAALMVTEHNFELDDLSRWLFDAIKELKLANTETLGLSPDHVAAIADENWHTCNPEHPDNMSVLEHPECLEIQEKIRRRIEREEALAAGLPDPDGDDYPWETEALIDRFINNFPYHLYVTFDDRSMLINRDGVVNFCICKGYDFHSTELYLIHILGANNAHVTELGGVQWLSLEHLVSLAEAGKIPVDFGLFALDRIKEISYAYQDQMCLTGEEFELVSNRVFNHPGEDQDGCDCPECCEPPTWSCAEMSVSERLKALELLMQAKATNQPVDVINMLEMMLCLSELTE